MVSGRRRLRQYIFQALTSLKISQSYVSGEGATYLADALKVNQVRYPRCTLIRSGFHQYIQTINTLEIPYNYVGPEGTQYLADTLKMNKVR